jgi:hypothetical protein
MGKMTAIALAILCSSCATIGNQADEPREAREYRTGSRIPVRDRADASGVKTVDVDSLGDMGKGMPARRPGGGN